MLSAQSQDKRTAVACNQLFALADTPEEMIKLSREEIIEAIKPAGLYNAKSKNILATSKILIQVNLCVSCTTDGNKHFGLIMYRGSTEIGSGDASSWNSGVGSTHSATEQVNYSQPDKILTGCFLDSPNTTAATTYNIKSFIHDFSSSVSAKNLVVNGGGYSYNNKETAITSSSITLMEITA